MGLTFSLPSNNDASIIGSMPSQTPKRRRLPPRPIPPNTVIRRSRRLTKANPPKVIFPTYPEAKSPFCKSYPLTPRSRRRLDVRPILRTPRFTKKKVHKKKQTNKKYKSVLEMVPGSPDGSVGTAATEYSK